MVGFRVRLNPATGTMYALASSDAAAFPAAPQTKTYLVDQLRASSGAYHTAMQFLYHARARFLLVRPFVTGEMIGVD